ncbi:hypothetical protein AYK24_06890 [Thermoplasmatales archaeon SG8-52-4]|nr:MAG: hypothetical protein AYK24_06890 [Thermoplasmatales archaeon SG8-52-4]
MSDVKNDWNIIKWKSVIKIAGIIAVLDSLLLLFGTLELIDIAFSVGCIGIITFLGVLMLVNFMSETKELKKGEMRKAIAASFTTVYFAVLSLLIFTDLGQSASGLSKTMIDHFTYLVGIIVVFYFGSRSVDKYVESKKDNLKGEAQVLEGKAEVLKNKIKLEEAEAQKIKIKIEAQKSQK